MFFINNMISKCLSTMIRKRGLINYGLEVLENGGLKPVVNQHQTQVHFSNRSKDIGKVKILLDPGHGLKPDGSYDPGSVYRDVSESHLNVDVALSCKSFLEVSGFQCDIVKPGLPLYERGGASEDYDIFISIHHNASGIPGVQGVEVFHHTDKYDNSDIEISKYIVNEISNMLGVDIRGHYEIGLATKKMKLSALSGSKDVGCPVAVLVECYFIDDSKIDNHSNWSIESGVALGEAIVKFIEGSKT